MKKLIILMALSVLVVPRAKAENCLKYPKKCLEELDRKRRRLNQAALDVISLGKTARDREDAKAEQAEAVAKAVRAAAKINLKTKIDDKQAQIASYNGHQITLNLLSANLNLIYELTSSNVNLIKTLYLNVQNHANVAEVMQQIVKNQATTFAAFANSASAGNVQVTEEISSISEDLIKRLNSYNYQLEHIPTANSNPEDFDKWFAELSTQCYELLVYIKQDIEFIKNQIAQNENNTKVLEASLEELNKTKGI